MELAKCDLREISQKGADTLSLHILPCALFLLLPGMQHDAEGGMIVNSQAPLSMGFSRQEDWSGLPFPSPGDLPDPGIKPASPALQVNFLPLSHQRSRVYIFLSTTLSKTNWNNHR